MLDFKHPAGFPTPVGTAKFQFWMKPYIDVGGFASGNKLVLPCQENGTLIIFWFSCFLACSPPRLLFFFLSSLATLEVVQVLHAALVKRILCFQRFTTPKTRQSHFSYVGLTLFSTITVDDPRGGCPPLHDSQCPGC